jgi:hypothetical protein
MNTTLVVGIIAALVAICGYTITSAMNRIERRSKVYADAILAVIRFQELPYRIRRRPDSGNETRAAIYQRIRDTQETLSYYAVLLRLDSPKVGKAFGELVKATREIGLQYRRDAWAAPPATKDEDMNLPISYKYENELELEKCIARMQQELSILRILLPQVGRSLRESAAQTPGTVSRPTD